MRRHGQRTVTLVSVLLVACVAGHSAWTAEDQTEEARVWQAEEKMLAKAALEQDGHNPLERSYVGKLVLEKAGFSENEKESVQTVNVGRFLTKGYVFILRLESADLLETLRKVPARKPVNLTGTVRVNGKYFVARDVSLAVPGEGSAAPRARRRRGGI